jgi:hypothetical protein
MPIPPGAIIGKRETVRLVKKFKKSGEKNTKAVWFSISDLEDIITMIKDLTDPTQNKTGDGVRIYISRYPKNYPDSTKHEKNSLVFVPTFNISASAIHEDYMSQGEVEILTKEIKDPDSGPYPLHDDSYNHGELCPTLCNGANVGNYS